MKSFRYLWIIGSKPLIYDLGKYPENQVKLNYLHPISISSGSIDLVLTVAEVASYGPEEVFYLRLFESFNLWYRGIRSAFSGRVKLMEAIL